MKKQLALTADLVSQERADKYLHELFSEQEELSHLSRSQIQKLIENGAILVNGKTIRSKDLIPLGSSVQIDLPEALPLEAVAENIPLQILYEDSHLVVVNKAPGLTVHPSETQHQGTLVNALLFHVKDLSGIGGVLRPGIVHRIDKDTSGALVISKDDATHLGLSKLFSTHNLTRKYWALVYGLPKFSAENEPFRLETTLGRSPKDRTKMMVDVTPGRKAVSFFRVLEAYGEKNKAPFASLVECTLETGRTHQVRVHLTHLGHSLLGDPVYGEPTATQLKWRMLPKSVQRLVEELPGQALHARTLGFQHPITQKSLIFEAEPFENFSALLAELRQYTG